MDIPICQHKRGLAGKSTRPLTVKLVTRPLGHKVADSMPPGKSPKESPPQPYRKPTQVDEESIHRRSREHSFRNSAN
jgi:hypothetical protein